MANEFVRYGGERMLTMMEKALEYARKWRAMANVN